MAEGVNLEKVPLAGGGENRPKKAITCCGLRIETCIKISFIATGLLSLTFATLNFVQWRKSDVTPLKECVPNFKQMIRISAAESILSGIGAVAALGAGFLYNYQAMNIPAALRVRKAIGSAGIFLITSIACGILNGVELHQNSKNFRNCENLGKPFITRNNWETALSIIAAASSVYVIGLLWKKVKG